MSNRKNKPVSVPAEAAVTCGIDLGTYLSSVLQNDKSPTSARGLDSAPIKSFFNRWMVPKRMNESSEIIERKMMKKVGKLSLYPSFSEFSPISAIHLPFA